MYVGQSAKYPLKGEAGAGRLGKQRKKKGLLCSPVCRVFSKHLSENMHSPKQPTASMAGEIMRASACLSACQLALCRFMHGATNSPRASNDCMHAGTDNLVMDTNISACVPQIVMNNALCMMYNVDLYIHPHPPDTLGLSLLRRPSKHVTWQVPYCLKEELSGQVALKNHFTHCRCMCKGG